MAVLESVMTAGHKWCLAAGSDAFFFLDFSTSTVRKYFDTSPPFKKIVVFPLFRHVFGRAVKVLQISDWLFSHSVSFHWGSSSGCSSLFVCTENQRRKSLFGVSVKEIDGRKKAFSNTVDLQNSSPEFCHFTDVALAVFVCWSLRQKASWAVFCEILKKKKKLFRVWAVLIF